MIARPTAKPTCKQATYVALLNVLSNGVTGTVKDLAASIGSSYRTVWEYVREMHTSGEGIVRIVAWRREGTRGPCRRIFGAGPGPDAPKPERVPMAERVKKYQQSPRGRKVTKGIRKRRRADPDKWMDIKTENARAYEKTVLHTRTVEKCDPLLAALMGRKANG